MTKLDGWLLALFATFLVAGGAFFAGKARGETAAKLAASDSASRAEGKKAAAWQAVALLNAHVADSLERHARDDSARLASLLARGPHVIRVMVPVAPGAAPVLTAVVTKASYDSLVVACRTSAAATYVALAAKDSVIVAGRALIAALHRQRTADSTSLALSKQRPGIWSLLKQRCGVSVGYGLVSGKADVVAGCNILP